MPRFISSRKKLGGSSRKTRSAPGRISYGKSDKKKRSEEIPNEIIDSMMEYYGPRTRTRMSYVNKSLKNVNSRERKKNMKKMTKRLIQKLKAKKDYRNDRIVKPFIKISEFGYPFPEIVRNPVAAWEEAAASGFEDMDFNVDPLFADPEKIKGHYGIILEEVKLDGMNLEYASDNLKGKKEIVIAAVKNNPESLQFASDKFRDDPKFLLELMQNCESNWYHIDDILKYASERVKKDRQFQLDALKMHNQLHLLEGDLKAEYRNGTLDAKIVEDACKRECEIKNIKYVERQKEMRRL